MLEVKNLSIEFTVDGQWLPAVSDVSFQVAKGEILALVGESGCGKSVTCMSLARLLPEPPARYKDGSIFFQHQNENLDIFSLNPKELRELRGGRIAYIFQEPAISLNPVFKVGDQIAEAILLHRPRLKNIKSEVVSLLEQVGIPEPEKRFSAYPHEMSGGMQQRVMIAMALASDPDLLVADEPTTALDVTIQAQILDLLRELRKKTEMAIIIVTHNLGIVSELADRVMVMYAGRTVEEAPARELMRNPKHPYTRALLRAVPKLGHAEEELNTIAGTVPSPLEYPSGCRFSDRCEVRAKLAESERQRCLEINPEWKEVSSKHFCRCWHV